MKFTATLMATLACTQAIRIGATVDSQVEQRIRDLIDTPWSGNLVQDLRVDQTVDPIIPVVADASDDVFAGMSHASAMQGLALNFAAEGGYGNMLDDAVSGGLGWWSNGIG